MTPEDDVNKDKESSDKADSELTEDTHNATDGAVPEAEKTGADFADKAAEALREVDASKDDIDAAANAQAEASEAEQPEATVNADDPLGFLDKNPDGAVENPDDELTSLRTQLSDYKAQVSAQQDQLLRIQAEMENQRKRAQNDVTKAHKFALEKIALDLLPVKDSLEMGLQAATVEDAELSKIIEGSELTLKMLAQALEKYNIVEVNPIDEKFDPEFHQAMSMQPVEGKEPNTVASVMQKGYTLNERLIRPALVMVAK